MSILNVDHILEGERYLDAIAVIVRPKNDALQALNPFFGALCAVGFEVVGSVMRDEREMDTILVLVIPIGQLYGDSVPKVDLSMREVQVCRVVEIRQDVPLQTEQVPTVGGISLAALE